MTVRAATRASLEGRPRPPLATAILVPVLGRPQNVAPLLESIAENTPEPWRVVFILDDDDDDEAAAVSCAQRRLQRDPWPILAVTVPAGTCYAAKINEGARATDEPCLFQGADDLRFHPGWLTRAQARLNGRVHVVGTNDLYNPRVIHGKHSTHSLVTREYVNTWGTIDEPGLVMHPGYPHAYCDDEFVQTARSRRAFAMARDAVVEHLHPFAGKAMTDATYLKGRGLDNAGRAVYESRRSLWTRQFGP